MPYCLTCGRLAELSGGQCERCRRDFAVNGKSIHPHRLPETVTRKWIVENAMRYNTVVSRAFLLAAKSGR